MDPKDLPIAYKISKEIIISEYNLKVANKNSKYHYPNYNNICLMLKYLSKSLHQQNNLSKYIYVKRKESTSSGRQLDNEHILEEKLVSLGFKPIYPEDYSFMKQISIFYNAKIVVGASGSALLNSIFCKKSSHIVELCPDVDFRPGVWLNSVMSGSFYHFFSGPSRGKIILLKPERFDINIPLIIERVKDIIRR